MTISTLMRTAAIACLMALSACATQFRSEVQSFHKLAGQPAGQTFRVLPADPAKTGSLEFDSYASLVRAELVRLGYTPVNAANAADVDVKLGYSVSDPIEKIDSRPAFATVGYGFYGLGYGGYYGYRGHRGYSAFGYDPFFNSGLYRSQEAYSYTVYTRKLNLTMTRGSSTEQLYDGKVESTGSDNRLPELMPYLVQSMFQDFPGQSGVTRRVVIELPRAK